MSQESVEIVRRILDGWGTGDFRVAVAELDPHVMIVVPPTFPESGVFVGVEAIGEFARRFLEQYERVAIEAIRLREVGDTVLAEVVQVGTGRLSGIDVRNPYFMLFTFRAGKLYRMESVIDEDRAINAAGLRE